MGWRRRIELFCGIATVVLGAAGLAYAGMNASDATGNCVTTGNLTYCQSSSSGELASTSAPGWPGVILAALLFTPILVGVLGFTIGDSVSRARGSLVLLWLFALLLAGAVVVALLPLVTVVNPPILPSGLLFLPTAVLGFATALLGVWAALVQTRPERAN